MGIPNQAEVEAVLEPYESDLNEIILSGWDFAWSLFQQRPWRTSRGRANLVNDFIVDNALQKWGPSVRPIERHQTVYFVIEDLYLLRFKQLDGTGRSRNYPTKRAKRYLDPNYNLFGSIDWPRIEVGHVFNETGTGIKAILVVARNRGAVEWCYPIWPGVEKTETLPFIERAQPRVDDLWQPRKQKDVAKVQSNED